MHPLGQTRTSIQANHAFISPDGHVPAALPGWSQTDGIILISPVMRGGPRFSQYLALMQTDGTSGAPLPGIQRFVYVIEGHVAATLHSTETTFMAGDFVYLPADTEHQIKALEESKLLLIEAPYRPSSVTDKKPEVHAGNAWESEGDPFLGDEDARLRVLLPTDFEYDMAVNLFTFQAGAALPFVETHIMEHGLYLLEGQGIYRLDDSWYPIQVGDVIWMGSYCPQWFCAIGKTQSTYIYYKDVNRDPLA